MFSKRAPYLDALGIICKSMLMADNGRVFVCGSNSEGQLGLGEDTRSSVNFAELKFMEKIAFVECGYYHTVFITGNSAKTSISLH